MINLEIYLGTVFLCSPFGKARADGDLLGRNDKPQGFILIEENQDLLPFHEAPYVL